MPARMVPQRYEPAVPLDELTPHPRNPNIGDPAAIRTSIEASGFAGSLLVQASTGHIIAGNHTWQAARAAGLTHVPALYVDVDDQTAEDLMLAVNELARRGQWDRQALAVLLRERVDRLPATGFDQAALNRLEQFLAEAAQVDPLGEWQAMPDYENADLRGAASVIVHFATEQDTEAFFKLIGQPRPKGPRLRGSIWWPARDGHRGMDLKAAYASVDPEEEQGAAHP
jgi:ParB-like nuclease domain